jgi:hypothetical protein
MTGVPLGEFPRDRSIGSADHEIKFAVPASAADPLRAWVTGVCRPDAAHPPARVWTVYFDTPGLSLLSEKIDSDYLKTKVRVRWYGAIDGRDSPVFAEVKQRVGIRRDKTRVELDVTPAELARLPLHEARWPALLATLRAAVPTLPARLAPVLCLSYTRHRFVDPAVPARLGIDSDIRVTEVNTMMIHGHVPVGLDHAVFAYKGRLFDLPPHLRPIVRFGARRQAFSKYLACYQAVSALVL